MANATLRYRLRSVTGVRSQTFFHPWLSTKVQGFSDTRGYNLAPTVGFNTRISP
ncbi:hypothetical protein VB711_01885 [Cronbergia sp. UHCC 0137]|uniref:hypothetical protein n=1 Tax=Cronbergia sp. UHCC 0137 TaxID=3110239 RepID=UPI002B1F059D|nr:hypothetical protein [Cronbergia sp. UHCC 0137]MEA5616593.1 hypothetical protein [Cronbergia sp. UHCC 0137]